MASRCSGCAPPERMDVIAAPLPCTNASRIFAWISASASMAILSRVLANAIGLGGLSAQDCQCRQIVVPFHDRGLGAESADRVCVELPCRFRHRRSMSVDQQRLALSGLIVFRAEPSEVEFSDCGCGKPVDEAMRVVSHVVGAQIDVADIA